MIGAIVGDIVGSRFEFDSFKSKKFEFFTDECDFTDDSIMSLAICKAFGYAITGIKCREAILESEDGFSTTTSIPRDKLIRTQTPQTFRLGNIIGVHEEAKLKGIADSVASCTLCAEVGNREMHIVPGSEKNIKITTVEDLEILKALMHTTKEDWLK